jgi:hypothetical protein
MFPAQPRPAALLPTWLRALLAGVRAARRAFR